jgi:hypothetical protein
MGMDFFLYTDMFTNLDVMALLVEFMTGPPNDGPPFPYSPILLPYYTHNHEKTQFYGMILMDIMDIVELTYGSSSPRKHVMFCGNPVIFLEPACEGLLKLNLHRSKLVPAISVWIHGLICII